jgi:hypothetical protein
MSIVRVKSDVRATVFDASTGGQVALLPGEEYEDTDPIVKAHRWAFQTDSESDATPRVRSMRVEQATAVPGERRNR